MIPTVLSNRFEMLQQLDTSSDLLMSLQASGADTGAERAFLEMKIRDLEEELQQNEGAAEEIINQLKSDPEVWLVARLRFFCGYSWIEIGEIIGKSTDAIKTKFLRNIKYQPKGETT